MGQSPKYNVGEIVYLKESAKIGFLESYGINKLHSQVDGQWVYTISIAKAPPQNQSAGDRTDLRAGNKTLYFSESELIEYCDALDFAINHAQTRLARLQQLKAGQCEEGSE